MRFRYRRAVHEQPLFGWHDDLRADRWRAEPIDELGARQDARARQQRAHLRDAHDGRADQQFAVDGADDRELVYRVVTCGQGAGDYRDVWSDVVQRVARQALHYG